MSYLNSWIAWNHVQPSANGSCRNGNGRETWAIGHGSWKYRPNDHSVRSFGKKLGSDQNGHRTWNQVQHEQNVSRTNEIGLRRWQGLSLQTLMWPRTENSPVFEPRHVISPYHRPSRQTSETVRPEGWKIPRTFGWGGCPLGIVGGADAVNGYLGNNVRPCVSGCFGCS